MKTKKLDQLKLIQLKRIGTTEYGLKKEETNIKILDVYPTNIKTWPERENAMEIDFVLNKIYEAMINGETELILDGRK